MMLYWNIFWRTFAQLAAASLLVIQVPDLIDEQWIKNTGGAVGLAMLSALIGGLIAAGWAFVRTPAVTALDKAVRSAIEKILGGLGALVFNTWAEVVAVPKILIGTIVVAVLSFAVTYFQYQGPVPVPDAEGPTTKI
jgi:hypothetical protein